MSTQTTGPIVTFTADTTAYGLGYCGSFITIPAGTKGELVSIRRLADFNNFIVRLDSGEVSIDFGHTLDIAPMTTERADAAIENTAWADRVEDSEEIGGEVVYTLEDGSALHVDQLGGIRHCRAA